MFRFFQGIHLAFALSPAAMVLPVFPDNDEA
ncbi:hypothetical protein ABAC460_16540 [Asticcacaulis sp. AC460]|nr:hypothetical protein ABAC460_16540 [Asticcacaulis sp. AC460]